MIKFKNINGLKHAKEILDGLKSINKMIEVEPEDSIRYEIETERIGEQLCELDEFFTGMENITDNNLINADLRMMAYWNYVKEEITFDKLLHQLKNNSSD